MTYDGRASVTLCVPAYLSAWQWRSLGIRRELCLTATTSSQAVISRTLPGSSKRISPERMETFRRQLAQIQDLFRACFRANALKRFGWEAWTRTRIARSRVWSPTNWTTSQQEEQKRIAARSRGSGQPRFTSLI